MVKKPSTIDEAIAYVWDIPDMVIGPADKQSLVAALAEKTDAVARRYFSAPNPELWVGTLRELLKPAGTQEADTKGWFNETHEAPKMSEASRQSPMFDHLLKNKFLTDAKAANMFDAETSSGSRD